MLCALLTFGCAKTQAAPEPAAGPTPLTASAALGDFATVDYCSLLDVPAVAPGADAAVGSVFAAITANKIKRLKFPNPSWGQVLPCAVLDDHALDAVAGAASRSATGLSGHSCIRGKIGFKLTVETVEDKLPAGPPETVGGRDVRLRIAGAFCFVDTTQPAPGLPGRRELAEISVVETAGTAGGGAR